VGIGGYGGNGGNAGEVYLRKANVTATLIRNLFAEIFIYTCLCVCMYRFFALEK
jgi:GTPase involved in cell partitioning and DNA repair